MYTWELVPIPNKKKSKVYRDLMRQTGTGRHPLEKKVKKDYQTEKRSPDPNA
jgi:hypothetical protein